MVMRASRPLLLILVSAFVLTLEGSPTPGPTPAAAQPMRATSKASSKTFDPATVVPLPGSSIAAMREAIARDDFADASRIADAAIPNERPIVQGRLRWLAARAALDAGDESRALTFLRELSTSDHLLARWAKIELAERIEGTVPTEAARLVQSLRQGWAGADRAQRIYARSLLATTGSDEAVALLRALVARAPSDVGAASVAMPLARVLEQRDDLAAKKEALDLYRRVASRAPGSEVGALAAERVADLLTALPPEQRRELAAESSDDLFFRATAFYESMQHERAAKAFADVAALPTIEPSLACKARMMQGRALWRARERATTLQHMQRVAADCDLADAKAWAHFLAARSLSSAGRYQEAIQHYDALVREVPEHRLADDAALRAALGEAETGDDAAMVRRLEALVEQFPRGDMRPDALFRLAWSARRKGDHAKAVAYLDRLEKEGNGEHDEGIEGRALYWRARSQTALGHGDLAVRDYVAIARRYPLAYYAQLALQRLAEVAAPRAQSLLGTLRGGSETLAFPMRPELQHSAFRRALELLRVGAFEHAALELEGLGVLGEGADRDILWLAAALFDRAGDAPRAARIVRRRLSSFRRVPPVGRSRALWRLAYPNAYAPLIEQAAQGEGLPPAFVRAIAREESTFDANAVSHAHAYGLVQLILPTARRHGRPLGLEVTARTLRDPAVNLRVGARFMAFLWRRYADNPAVVPSAYNAGEGATDRWLRERPDRSLDEWVEEIPYDETRRYTRRVLQSFGVYQWLETGALPSLGSALPQPRATARRRGP